MIPVAVLTPTLNQRVEVFAEFRRSVARQTAQPATHLWISEDPAWTSFDDHLSAMVSVHNRLLKWAWRLGYSWVVTADDDDEWSPDHLETLWRRHLEVPVPIVYAITPPKAGSWQANSHGANPNQALLYLPEIMRVGGYVERPGMNEDVAADQYWQLECGLAVAYTDHPTYAWVRGSHLHAIDVYKQSDPKGFDPERYAVERAKEPIAPGSWDRLVLKG